MSDIAAEMQQLEQDLATALAQVETLTAERDAAVKDAALLGEKVKALESALAAAPEVAEPNDVTFNTKAGKFRFTTLAFILNGERMEATEVVKNSKLCAEIAEKYPGIVEKL